MLLILLFLLFSFCRRRPSVRRQSVRYGPRTHRYTHTPASARYHAHTHTLTHTRAEIRTRTHTRAHTYLKNIISGERYCRENDDGGGGGGDDDYESAAAATSSAHIITGRRDRAGAAVEVSRGILVRRSNGRRAVRVHCASEPLCVAGGPSSRGRAAAVYWSAAAAAGRSARSIRVGADATYITHSRLRRRRAHLNPPATRVVARATAFR